MYTAAEKLKMFEIGSNQTTTDLYKFKAGDTLIVLGYLDTPFEQYERVVAVTDTEDGIFESRPYITVATTDGRRCCMHASRCIPAN